MGDLFDSSVNLEDQYIQEGRQQGLRDGKAAGLKEGREFGVYKGFEIGQEVWRKLQQEDPASFSSRAERLLASLEQDERLQDALEELRGKFTAMVAVLGLQSQLMPKAAGSDAAQALSY